MHTQRAVFNTLIFSILYIAFFTAQSAFAGNNAGFVSSFTEDNNSIFERSDVRMAVDHFCRTLSIDPQNKTVQKNLETIISDPGLTATQKSDALLLEDHLSYIKNLQGRVEYLTSKRNLLRDQLIENGHESEVLLKGLFDIKNNISGSHEIFSYQQQSWSDRKSPLIVINNLLANEKVHLSVRVRSLQNQYDWLRAVNKNEPYLPARYFTVSEFQSSFMESVEMPVFASLKEGDAIDSPEAIIHVVEEKRADGIAPASQGDERTDLHEETMAEIISLQSIGAGEKMIDEKTTERFKKELGALYVQLDKLEERIGKENGKVSELESQVVDLSLKLSETEIQLNEKAEAVDSLTAQLTDAEQRFVLGQRIIQEKDEEMQSLQEDLQKIRLEAESQTAKHNDMTASKEREVADLQKSLLEESKKREELNGVIAAKDWETADLQKSLLEESKKKEELNGVIAAKDQKLTKLEASLSEADKQKEEWNDIVVSKDQYLAELEAFLKISRDDLAKSNEDVQGKIENLRAMKKELADVQAKVRSGQKVIREKGEEITALRDELANAQLITQKEPEGVNVLLAKKNKELKDLNGFLNIYRQGLGDANRVIEQKSGQLESLEREFSKLQNQLALKEGNYEKKDYQVRILKEKLLCEKEKKEQRNINLRKVVLQRDQEIDDLTEQLERTQRSLQAANRTIQEKVAYLNYAKNELAALRERMGSDEKEVKLEEPKNWAFPDEKLIELSGILKIYKDKLLEETKAAQEKTTDISALEKHLALLENQLNEKSDALVKTQHDLHDLEGQLTAMKQELLRLRERPQDNGSQNDDVEAQVQELQSRFRDINDFLLENLRDSDRIKAHLGDCPTIEVFQKIGIENK